jgi:AcrR family transcriptional regulator
MAKSGYHHGRLADALVEAALVVVESSGAGALSLRDLAASLDVSRAAPYRHFADRDTLLAAVAARGFAALADVYEQASPSGGDGPSRLRQAMADYMAFARRRPGLHRLMFESDFLKRRPLPAVLEEPSRRTYEALWGLLEQAWPGADRAWLNRKRVTMLSTVVGFLVLDAADRFTAVWADPPSREQQVEAVLDAAIGSAPATFRLPPAGKRH